MAGKDIIMLNRKELRQLHVIQKVITKKVTVEERLDGSLAITHKKKELKFKQITQRPLKPKEQKQQIIKPKTRYIPPADHPWRKFKITKYYGNYLTNT